MKDSDTPSSYSLASPPHFHFPFPHPRPPRCSETLGWRPHWSACPQNLPTSSVWFWGLWGPVSEWSCCCWLWAGAWRHGGACLEELPPRRRCSSPPRILLSESAHVWVGLWTATRNHNVTDALWCHKTVERGGHLFCCLWVEGHSPPVTRVFILRDPWGCLRFLLFLVPRLTGGGDDLGFLTRGIVSRCSQHKSEGDKRRTHLNFIQHFLLLLNLLKSKTIAKCD